MRVVLTGDLVERSRQGMTIDPLMLGARLGVEVGAEAPGDPSRRSFDQRDDVGFARADQDVVGLEDRVGVVAVPVVGPERLGTVDFQVAPDVVGLASDASAQILEPLSSETEFVEMIACLPLPDDSAVGCDFVDSLVSDDVRAKRRNFTRDRHEDEAIAVFEQFPIVVLAGRTTRRLGPPLPEFLPRPRQLTNGPVAVDAARRVVQLSQLHTDVADASRVESRVDDPGWYAWMRPLVAYDPVEVDQSGDTVCAGIEDVAAVRAAGVVV